VTNPGDTKIGDTVVVDAGVVDVLSTLAVRGVLVETEAEFRARTGLAITARYKSTNAQLIAIAGGATADVAIITHQAIDQLTAESKIVPGSAKDVAQSGVGLAVRSGAPKPDISTVEAFKQTILAAKSIAFSRLGASGVHFAEVIERLGIAEEIRRKAVISDAYMGDIVVRGEAELAVQQVSELMLVAGIDIVGPLPGDLQKISLFTAAVFTAAKNPAGGAKLVSFLAAPELAPILERKGLSAP
jgi:molybdate transport system substrate-binding protein